MLQSLRVSSFAIIDELTVELDEGFTALTGETGAGKSLLVDAIALVLGGRGSADLIRTGAEAATVEAMFSLDARAREAAEGLGLELDGDELLVKRVLGRSGRNRAWINGAPATLGMLQTLSRSLLSIAGQHEHQSLLESASQRALLDAAAAHAELLAEMAGAHGAWAEARREAEVLAQKETDRARREDYLRFQVEELRRAGIKPGEEAELIVQRQRLTHGVALAEAVNGSEEALYSGDGAVLDRLKAVIGRLGTAAKLDSSLAAPAAAIEAARVEIEEVARELRAYRAAEADPGRLQEIEDRLALLDRLRKKHGVGGGEEGAAALVALHEALEGELAELSSFDETLAARRAAEAAAREKAEAIAARLTKARKAAAKKLAAAVVEELMELGMPSVRFHVEVRPAELSASGGDEVEMLLAANPGEEPKPLAKIASGGELSRVMLAIKCVAVEHQPAASYVFDEVDAGIGGAIAERVGKKLAAVAKRHQVLCVTHLAQIASLADTQLKVAKRVDGGRTAIEVAALDTGAREEEVARMLGGVQITAATRAHAREMLGSRRAPQRIAARRASP